MRKSTFYLAKKIRLKTEERAKVSLVLGGQKGFNSLPHYSSYFAPG